MGLEATGVDFLTIDDGQLEIWLENPGKRYLPSEMDSFSIQFRKPARFMSVEIQVVYEGDLRSVATHGPSGAQVTTDAPVDNGGLGSQFSPTDLVATALGTCVCTILGLVADRHALDLSGTRVKVQKEMVTSPHRRIGKLITTVMVPQGAVDDSEMRQRLETAACTCPVHRSLHPDIDAPIQFEYA